MFLGTFKVAMCISLLHKYLPLLPFIRIVYHSQKWKYERNVTNLFCFPQMWWVFYGKSCTSKCIFNCAQCHSYKEPQTFLLGNDMQTHALPKLVNFWNSPGLSIRGWFSLISDLIMAPVACVITARNTMKCRILFIWNHEWATFPKIICNFSLILWMPPPRI